MRTKTKLAGVTLVLTEDQVEGLRRQLTPAAGADWIDDPAILDLLRRRERTVARELRAGRFTTLSDLQRRYRRDREHT